MNKIYLLFALPAVLFLSLMIFSKKMQPTIWAGYRILAVQTSITEKDVLNLLAEKKLTKVISLSSERYNPFDRKNP
ncbi:MAG: hypothetical protein ACRC4W_02210, partial [Treponemataceae bacterium]